MVVVERDENLLLLRKCLADGIQGKGGVALLSGPVGSGKTELLRQITDHATAADVLVLAARGSRTEHDTPLGILRQLFHSTSLPPGRTEIVEQLLHSGARTAMARGPEQETIEQVDAQITHGLCAEIFELAGDCPLLIVVDDAHHADISSIQCLLRLIHQLRSSRVTVMFAECEGPQPVHPLFHAELLRQPHCRRIQLVPLSQRAVFQILEQQMDAPTARRLVKACHQISGGNPLLLRALLEDYQMSAMAGAAELVVGTNFKQALLACLHRSTPTALEAARGIAVLGESSTATLIGQLLNAPIESAVQTMLSLDMAGLLQGERFRHPAIRSVVLDDMSPQALADTHRRAARLLYHGEAQATVIAKHLIAAEHIQVPWALTVLLDAAKDASANDQSELAIECLELASQAATDEQQRAAILVLLARATSRISPVSAARQFLDLADIQRAGRLEIRDAALIISHQLWFGRFDEGVSALEQLKESAVPSDAGTAAELRAARARLASWFPPLQVHIPETMTTSPLADTTPATGDKLLRAATVLRSVLTQGVDEAIIAEAEHVLKEFQAEDECIEDTVSALIALIYSDRMDLAVQWCNRLLKEASARRSSGWQTMFAIVRAEIAIRQGDLPAAEKHSRSALANMPWRSTGVANVGPLSSLLWATTAMGKYKEAASVLNQPVPDGAFQSRFGLHYLHARGHYHLTQNRFDAALEDFTVCGDLMTDWGMDLPSLIPWRTGAALACLHLGQTYQARELVNDQLRLVLVRLGTVRSRAHGITLRALAAVSETGKRPPLLKQAASEFQECGDRLELAHTLADLSRAHRELGETSQAQMAARQAQHLAVECRAEPLVMELSNHVNAKAEVAVHVEDGTLTDGERRVAELAASGHTNRQIADKLYITVSTVEQHLTKVYRKLNVTHRAALSTRFPRDGIADSA
ncbi:AAA family ATPase [Streptosporangium sp. NPDC000396]|uniref:helix-turn-helix transcriptional regulator n=1 Tax=Streptosporangium sp. NPDC000396 TaxID=3366185 RepID=UPI0036AAADF1